MFPPLFLSLGWMTNHFGHTYRDKNIQKKTFLSTQNETILKRCDSYYHALYKGSCN